MEIRQAYLKSSLSLQRKITECLTLARWLFVTLKSTKPSLLFNSMLQWFRMEPCKKRGWPEVNRSSELRKLERDFLSFLSFLSLFSFFQLFRHCRTFLSFFELFSSASSFLELFQLFRALLALKLLELFSALWAFKFFELFWAHWAFSRSLTIGLSGAFSNFSRLFKFFGVF